MKRMNKQNVAVFFGSRSPEHDVSIVTALAAVVKPLELSGKYIVTPVYIAKDGQWYSDEKLKDISLYSSGKIEELIKASKPIQLSFEGGLALIKPGLRPKKIQIDIAFPATHGANGEDGALMGVFRMANIPFVGCDVAASAIAMDKLFAKQVAVASGISTPNFVAFASHEFAAESENFLDKVRQELQFPLFVKPARLGSSIGISRVKDFDGLSNAIEVAAHYDDKVIVEEGVQNLIEVTVPIIGNEDPRPALVEQPLLSTEDFFDFETKYMHGGKKGGGKKTGAAHGAQGYSKLPADIPKELYQIAVDTALAVYRAVNCSGIARIDLLIDSKAEKVYFNELNPLPGSLYAHNWRATGLSSVGLVSELVELAVARHWHQNKLESVFQTNFLKQF
jgi:D-alanine-D-alanine ligase